MVSQVAASCMSITTKILSYFCYESVKNTCSTCSVALFKTNAFVLKKKKEKKQNVRCNGCSHFGK